MQVFFPYLIIYIQNYLGIKDYAIVLGVVLIFASVVSVVSGRFIDRVGKMRFTVPAAAIMLIGLAAMYFVRGNAGVMVAGSVMMSGYMMMSAALGANIRDWTPKDKAGHFQGIRMIFAVMLPMIIGPAIGAEVIRNSDSTYMELGQLKTVPTPGIFLAAAAVLLLTAVPVLMLRKSEKESYGERDERCAISRPDGRNTGGVRTDTLRPHKPALPDNDRYVCKICPAMGQSVCFPER